MTTENSKVYIINIDLFYKIDRCVWIINKYNPSIPLLKISEEDFFLIETGQYRSQNISIRFNGKTYWISSALFATINKLNVPIEKLGISRAEFYNSEYTSQSKFTIGDFGFIEKFDTNSSIVLYTENILEGKYVSLINNIMKEFSDRGLNISKIIYLPIQKDNGYLKENLVMKYLIGGDIKSGKVVNISDASNKEIFVYEDISYFKPVIENNSLQERFNYLLKYSSKEMRKQLLEMDIFKSEIIYVYQTNNILNKTIKHKMNISYPSSMIYLKSFENLNAKRFF